MKPAYRFARGGEVYKEVATADIHLIEGNLSAGIIRANDDYWAPGMSNWAKVYTRQWTPTDAAAGENSPNPPPPSPPAVATKKANSYDIPAASPSPTCESCGDSIRPDISAISGYALIAKALNYLLYATGSVIAIAVLTGVLQSFTQPDPSERQMMFLLLIGVINAVFFILAIGLFVMSVVELRSAAVTHELYRFKNSRCARCRTGKRA